MLKLKQNLKGLINKNVVIYQGFILRILKSRNKVCYSIPITRLDFVSEDKENFELFTNSKSACRLETCFRSF